MKKKLELIKNGMWKKSFIFIISVIIVIITSVPFLGLEVKDLKSGDVKKRVTAVENLGKLGKKEIIPQLIDVMKTDREKIVRKKVIEVLCNIGDKSAAIDIMNHIKTETDTDIKCAGIMTLGYLRDERTVSYLRGVFLDKNESISVRLRAGNTLGRFMTEESFSSLKTGLSDENPKIRAQSVASLGNILSDFRLKERIELLQNVLKSDPDEDVKKTAKFHLERFTGKQ